MRTIHVLRIEGIDVEKLDNKATIASVTKVIKEEEIEEEEVSYLE